MLLVYCSGNGGGFVAGLCCPRFWATGGGLYRKFAGSCCLLDQITTPIFGLLEIDNAPWFARASTICVVTDIFLLIAKRKKKLNQGGDVLCFFFLLKEVYLGFDPGPVTGVPLTPGAHHCPIAW